MKHQRLGAEHINSRRALLVFSALLLVLSLPGVSVKQIPLLGIEVEHVGFGALLVGVAIANLYFIWLWMSSLISETGPFATAAKQDETLKTLSEKVKAIDAYIDQQSAIAKEYLAGAFLEPQAVKADNIQAITIVQDVRARLVGQMTRELSALLSMQYGVVPPGTIGLSSDMISPQQRLHSQVEGLIGQTFDAATENLTSPESGQAYGQRALLQTQQLTYYVYNRIVSDIVPLKAAEEEMVKLRRALA